MINEQKYREINKELLEPYFVDTSVQFDDNNPMFFVHYMFEDLYFVFREDKNDELSFVYLTSSDDEKRGYIKLMSHTEQFNYLLDYLQENIFDKK